MDRRTAPSDHDFAACRAARRLAADGHRPHPGLADAPLLRGGARAPARRGCRCGSCARPGGRCPSTGRSGARAASSTPSARPGPRRRDHPAAGAPLRRRRRHPLQRHRRAGRPPSASASTSRRASARSSRSRSAPPPTSTGCARSSPRSTRPTSLETVRLVVAELGATPLIGFAGAPFTVASYLIEGRPSRTYGLHQGADARRPDAVARSCSTGWPTWPSPRCARRSRPAPAPSSCSTAGPAR